MKTQKRTSSPKKKGKVVGDVVVGVFTEGDTPKEATPSEETKDKEYIIKLAIDSSEVKGLLDRIEELEKALEKTQQVHTLLEGVVPPEVVRVDHTVIIEELDSRIQELEKALEKANQQVEFQKWLVKDRMDALDVFTNNPWYKLLWMRIKGLI